MPGTPARPHRRRAAAGLAALALTASLVACGAHGDPSPSPGDSSASQGNPGAGPRADFVAVVTGDDVNALVAINVASQTVTRLVAIEQNEAHVDVDGVARAIPPVSVVLSDSTASRFLVWTKAAGGDTVAVRELDPATGEVRDVGVLARGVVPFLYEGNLAWASAPGDGQPRLLNIDGTWELGLPGAPSLVVAGPGAGRITAVIGPPNGVQRIVIVDVAKNEFTELPTEVGLRFGGIWADETTLVASVPTRLVPTLEDPENGEPDNRVLTWSVDGGSGAGSGAGLVEGPTVTTTDLYPTAVTSGHGLIVAASQIFDQPWVEAFAPGSDDPALQLALVPSGFITAMAVSGTTLVVLQEGHVTFIDLASGDRTTVEVSGVTETTWVGR